MTLGAVGKATGNVNGTLVRVLAAIVMWTIPTAKESFTHRILIRLLNAAWINIDVLESGGNVAVAHQDPDSFYWDAGLP